MSLSGLIKRKPLQSLFFFFSGELYHLGIPIPWQLVPDQFLVHGLKTGPVLFFPGTVFMQAQHTSWILLVWEGGAEDLLSQDMSNQTYLPPSSGWGGWKTLS